MSAAHMVLLLGETRLMVSEFDGILYHKYVVCTRAKLFSITSLPYPYSFESEGRGFLHDAVVGGYRGAAAGQTWLHLSRMRCHPVTSLYRIARDFRIISWVPALIN